MTEKIYLERHQGGQENTATCLPALFLPGRPTSLLTNPGEWFSPLRSEVTQRNERFGLRVTFILSHAEANDAKIELFEMSKALLDGLSWRFEGLFFQSGIRVAIEPGITVEWIPDPPDILTQLWVKGKSRIEGHLPQVSPPFKMNLLLHELTTGYNEIWNDGTLRWVTDRLQMLTNSSFSRAHVGAFTLARSNSRDKGISVGFEDIVYGEKSRVAKPMENLDSLAS